MIISVAELREFVTTDKTDKELEAMLSALELSIRKYTNNNFQNRAVRCVAAVVEGYFVCHAHPFKVGDTVQISEGANAGIYTVETADDFGFTTKEPVYDEDAAVVTLVVYPNDVKMGAVNMIKWDLEHRDKLGVQSETISRHAVTYFDMSGANTSIGYPVAITGFLKPYRKARF